MNNLKVADKLCTIHMFLSGYLIGFSLVSWKLDIFLYGLICLGFAAVWFFIGEILNGNIAKE